MKTKIGIMITVLAGLISEGCMVNNNAGTGTQIVQTGGGGGCYGQPVACYNGGPVPYYPGNCVGGVAFGGGVSFGGRPYYYNNGGGHNEYYNSGGCGGGHRR